MWWMCGGSAGARVISDLSEEHSDKLFRRYTYDFRHGL